MSISRRNFLRASLLGGGSAALLGSFSRVLSGTALAQGVPGGGTPQYQALVCIFLYGGNDSNNMLIPSDNTNYPFYDDVRGPDSLTPSDFYIPQSLLLPAAVGGNPPGFAPSTVAGKANTTNWYGLNNQMPMLASLLPTTPFAGGGPLAFVCNVGPASYPQAELMTATGTDQSVWPVNLYSHLDQQREWQTGQANPNVASPPNYGWGGVIGQFLPPATATGSTMPTVISTDEGTIFTMPDAAVLGSFPAASSSLPYVTLGGTIPQPQAGAPSNAQIIFPESSPLMNAMNEILTLAAANGSVVLAAQNATGDGGPPMNYVTPPAAWPDYPALGSAPNNTIFDQLNLVAQIIAGRQASATVAASLPVREIFFVGFGLFDSHNNQANEQGGCYDGVPTAIPNGETGLNLLAQLDAAMVGFYTAMKGLGLGSQVTQFTMSDFSRTYLSASGDGTDHAWGAHHLVLGDAVAGGVLYGQDPSQLLSSYVNGQNDGGNIYDAGAVDTNWYAGEGRWIPALTVCQYGYTLAKWLVSGLGAPATMSNIQPFAFPSLSVTNPATGKLWFPKATWDIGFFT